MKIFQKHNEVIFISLLTILSLILDVFFREDLFISILDMIVYLQVKLPSFAQYVFRIVSTLGDARLIMLIYFIVLACQINKFFFVKLGLFMCFIA